MNSNVSSAVSAVAAKARLAEWRFPGLLFGQAPWSSPTAATWGNSCAMKCGQWSTKNWQVCNHLWFASSSHSSFLWLGRNAWRDVSVFLTWVVVERILKLEGARIILLLQATGFLFSIQALDLACIFLSDIDPWWMKITSVLEWSHCNIWIVVFFFQNLMKGKSWYSEAGCDTQWWWLWIGTPMQLPSHFQGVKDQL